MWINATQSAINVVNAVRKTLNLQVSRMQETYVGLTNETDCVQNIHHRLQALEPKPYTQSLNLKPQPEPYT